MYFRALSPDRNLHHTIHLLKEPEQVYTALTQPSEWDAWFTSGTQFNLAIGDTILFRWNNWGPHAYSGEKRGKIVQLEQNERFVVEWQSIPTTTDSELHYSGLTTTVAFQIENYGRGSELHLTEGPFPDTTEGRSALIAAALAWGEALTLFMLWVDYKISRK